MATANVLRMLPHSLLRPAVQGKRRRGRLPPGVVSIKAVPRLKVGVLAEIVGSATAANNGKRVRIENVDPGAAWCFFCRSLNGDIVYSDGGAGRDVWLQAKNLRRVWTGNMTPS